MVGEKYGSFGLLNAKMLEKLVCRVPEQTYACTRTYLTSSLKPPRQEGADIGDFSVFIDSKLPGVGIYKGCQKSYYKGYYMGYSQGSFQGYYKGYSALRGTLRVILMGTLRVLSGSFRIPYPRLSTHKAASPSSSRVNPVNPFPQALSQNSYIEVPRRL